VIDGKTIGCIEIRAANVVIRNSKVSCGNAYAVYIDDRNTSASVTIEDSIVDCKATNGTGLGEARFTVRRTEIIGCENGLDMNQSIDVRDSYIHDLYNGGGAHADGAQASGHWDPSSSSYKPGALNITFVHNTIFGASDSGVLGTSAIISNRLTNGNPNGPDENWLIQGNLMGGGAVALYCEQDGAKGINYRVIDNAFTTRWSPKVGAYGVSTDCSDETQSGNYIQETGAPVNLP